nr:hypothetical protein [Tanacetum cinerariifolium]
GFSREGIDHHAAKFRLLPLASSRLKPVPLKALRTSRELAAPCGRTGFSREGIGRHAAKYRALRTYPLPRRAARCVSIPIRVPRSRPGVLTDFARHDDEIGTAADCSDFAEDCVGEVAFDLVVDRTNHVQQKRPLRRLVQAGVERPVQLCPAPDVVVAHELIANRLSPIKLGGGHSWHCKAYGLDLQQHPHFENLRQLRLGNPRDHGALVALELHQSFGLQALQGFTDRDLAHVEHPGNVVLANRLVLGELPRDDRLAQVFGDHLGRGGRDAEVGGVRKKKRHANDSAGTDGEYCIRPPICYALCLFALPRKRSVVGGVRQHHRQLAHRPAALGVPLVERRLHRCLIALTARHAVDDFLGVERSHHVMAGDEGVLADHAQETGRRQPAHLVAVLEQIAPQPDDVGHWPVGDEIAEAAVFMGDVEDQLRVARHALELAQVADDPRVLHQAFQMVAAHQRDFFRVEAEEDLLEGRPFGVHQAVFEAGTKHP